MYTHVGTRSSTFALAAVLGLASTLMPGTGHAQTETPAQNDGIADIIVTAEHRVVNVQKTGASVSVRTGDDLLKEGKFALSSILEDVPGITGGAAVAADGTAGGGTDNPGHGGRNGRAWRG